MWLDPILGVGELTTHFRTYFSGDGDVHWGYDLDFDPWPCVDGGCNDPNTFRSREASLRVQTVFLRENDGNDSSFAVGCLDVTSCGLSLVPKRGKLRAGAAEVCFAHC